MHRLRHKIKAEGRRLLRVLLLWLSAVSANSGSPLRRTRRRLLLLVTAMNTARARSSRNRLKNLHSLPAWWLPHAAILAGSGLLT